MTEQRTVLITGASSGFGRLTARTFQAEGWNVVATMRTPANETELNTLDNVLVAELDVTDTASIDAAVTEAIDRFGGIDVLVNNAGYGTRGFLEEASEAEVHDQFNTNVFGVIRMTQSVTPHMRQRGSGTIINVSSVSGIVGTNLNSLYTASKFAVHGLTESLALELGQFGITVKVVAPGAFGTGFLTGLHELTGNPTPELSSYRAAYEKHIAQTRERMASQGGTPSDPQEVADTIYRCATSDTPITNLVGSDAVGLAQAKASQPEDEFVAMMRGLTVPAPTENAPA